LLNMSRICFGALGLPPSIFETMNKVAFEVPARHTPNPRSLQGHSSKSRISTICVLSGFSHLPRVLEGPHRSGFSGCFEGRSTKVPTGSFEVGRP
jgi:hypothetical protein